MKKQVNALQFLGRLGTNLLGFIKFIAALLLFFSSQSYAGSYSDFFRAIETDDSAVVSNLLKRGFEPNAPTEDGQTPLIQAVKTNAIKTTRLLASSKGVDLDRTNLQDESPLMLAALNGNAEIVKYLVAQGAEVNKTGWTPLHYAATKGDVNIIKFLLAQSAYIDSESPNGTTPLMMAARYGTFEAVKLLIEEGADPTIRNNLKLNAIDFASTTTHPKLLGYLKTQTSIWILSHP